MSFAPCPKCRENVSLPPGVPDGAIVRCPLCQAEYPLVEALAHLPPRLIVVSLPATVASPAEGFLGAAAAAEDAHAGSSDSSVLSEGHGSSSYPAAGEHLAESLESTSAATATEEMLDEGISEWVPDEAMDGDALPFAEETHGAGGATAEILPGDEPFSFDEAPAPSVAIPMPALKTSPPRPKKKERNIIVTAVLGVVGLVTSGSLAFVFANLIVWWGFGKDGFEMGPRVAGYAPWIVPEKFHHSSDSSAEATPDANNTHLAKENGGTSGGTAGGVSMKAKSGDGTQFHVIPDVKEQKVRTGNGDNSSGEPDASSKLDTNVKPIDDPLETLNNKKPSDTKVPPPVATDQPETPDPNDPFATAKPSPDKPAVKPPSDKPDSAALGVVKGAPAIAEGALTKSVEQTQAALKTWDALPADANLDKKREALGKFRTAFADLAQTSTYGKEHGPEADSLLQEVAKDPGKFLLASKSAGQIIGGKERAVGGMLIAGVVHDVHPAGKLFELHVALPKGMETVEVILVTSQNPGDGAKGQQIVALGSVVEEPTKNLSGYEGDELQIVWSKHLRLSGKAADAAR